MNAYSQFITYQLAAAIGVIDKELEYDLAWSEAGVLYEEFENGIFDLDTKSEYDCIHDFLEMKMKVIMSTKAKAELEELKGNYEIEVNVTREYYKTASFKISLPRTMSKLEVAYYIDNNIDAKLEEAIDSASLNGLDDIVNYNFI